MTAEQGRLGAYSDCKNIIAKEPYFEAVFEVLTSPREIRHKFNGSKIFFHSYNNSETAKGIACDFLYINEANNFSLQQYWDLMANVRRGVFLDYNPNCKFWITDLFKYDDICHSTWKDNAYLTDMQRQYFAELYRLAHVPNPSAVNVRNYKVYYKGEYSEIEGQIFTADNIQWCKELPNGLKHFFTFADPSAMRGADWFANVLCALDADNNMWLIDTFSKNEGDRSIQAKRLMDWGKSYDLETMYIETNGLVGIDFFEFAQNSGLPVQYWYSKGNKFDRICSNFQNLTTRMFVLDTENNRQYFEQVYEFAEKCEHDDNIDAVNSAWNASRLFG